MANQAAVVVLREGELFVDSNCAVPVPVVDSPGRSPCSLALEASTVQSQLLLLSRHGPNRTLTSEQPLKLHTDVKRSRAVAILDQLAVLVLANAQAANLASVTSSHRWVRATQTHAPTARLRRVVLRSDSHHEPPRKLPHQPDTNARRIRSVASRK